MDSKINFHQPWVIDSRATNHISYDDSILFDLKISSNEIHVNITNGDSVPVHGCNGDSVPVHGTGSTCLPSNLKVNDVHYIPNFKYNLYLLVRSPKPLSISECFSDFYYIHDFHSRKLIDMGRHRNGVYKMG